VEGLIHKLKWRAIDEKSAPNPELAKRFMQFILQSGFQSTVGDG